MIKFFRQIRKSLLNEGKTSKYFKYAIGEIVLVVIGILIALQINNWNTKRLESIEERKILKNLKIDFEKNKELLQLVKEESKKGIQHCLTMLNYTGNKKKPNTENEFNSILNNLFVSPSYTPINSTLDEILNSGKLSVISNENLRKQLSSWPPMIELVKGMYSETDRNENLLNTYILENGSWLNADKVTSVKRSVNFPLSGFDTDNRTLLQFLEFENLVENIAIGLDNYLSKLHETSILLNEIETLIVTEIAND